MRLCITGSLFSKLRRIYVSNDIDPSPRRIHRQLQRVCTAALSRTVPRVELHACQGGGHRLLRPRRTVRDPVDDQIRRDLL